MARTPRKAEILLEYQNYIESPPIKPAQMYGAACSSDAITVESWRDIWIKNVTTNHKKFGSFKEHGVGKLFGINKNKPAIVIGSGPSLKVNADELKNRDDILTISCLHNYHYLEDKGVGADYYVSLDAGDVVLEEISEGGSKTPEEYWNSTKDRSLIAFVGSNPELFEKWQGKVYLFNAPVPDERYLAALEGLEIFNTYISNGGNVLGACMYIAKGVFGSNPIAFLGADFAFGYDKKFHGWNSKYDEKLGYVLKSVDVYGNKVLTWQSYYNFKNWFDYIACTVPGMYINCTEGGTFGAYPEGNIMAVKQMALSEFLEMYSLSSKIEKNCREPETKDKIILF